MLAAARRPVRRYCDEISLYSLPFLSTSAGEPVARSDRTARLGLPLPRLERAGERRMLLPQRRVARSRRVGPHRPDRQQLFTDQLQLRSHTPVVAARETAGNLRMGD